MYLPKMDKIFGSDYMSLSVDSARVKRGMKEGKNFHIVTTHKIAKTHWKAMDTNNKRCISQNYEEANTTKCITEFLENKVGCSVGLSGSNPKIKRLLSSFILKIIIIGMKLSYLHFRCNDTNDTEEFNKYMQLNEQLFSANDKDIFDMTGCLSMCDKYAYTTQQLGGMQYIDAADIPDAQMRPNTSILTFQLYYSDVEHELREQVNVQEMSGHI